MAQIGTPAVHLACEVYLDPSLGVAYNTYKLSFGQPLAARYAAPQGYMLGPYHTLTMPAGEAALQSQRHLSLDVYLAPGTG